MLGFYTLVGLFYTLVGLGISQFANHLANGIKIAPTMLKKMVQLRLLESSKCKLLFD